jgi:hypothetical protein
VVLIFGRFPTAERAETLLGIGFDILRAMCNLRGTLYRLFSNIAVNWKLGFHITLDDYHIVAVHPDTFGKRGYLPTEVVHTRREYAHNCKNSLFSLPQLCGQNFSHFASI